MILEESVREVIETARAEEVVGDFVNLKKRGQNYLGLCPFHGEKTPSFNVNPARNIYKCFGCGEAGDSVQFLMDLEQMTFPDAIRWLARRYNIKLKEKELSPELQAAQLQKESLILTNTWAQNWFSKQLHDTDEGKSVGLTYFKQRGFRRDIMDRYGLGYAPNDRDALLRDATAAGYKKEQLEQLGLIRHDRDFFRDRVMFTIHNLSGKPIAFAGRILRKDAKAPKYINSPETEVYRKSEVLFGISQAKTTIRKNDNVFLTEGYTDVISLAQNGVENAVASSGTSLTDGQVRLLRRLTQNVTLLYDGDKAGIKAALRGVDVLLRQDLNVRVVLLPDGADPDSYVREVGADAFKEYLREKSKDFLLFKTDLLLEDTAGDPIRRTDAVKEVAESLALIPDPIKRGQYVRECARLFGVEEELLIGQINKQLAKQLQQFHEKREAQPRQPYNPQLTPRPRPGGSDGDWPGEEPAWLDAESGSAGPDSDLPTPPPRPAVNLFQGDAYQEREIVRLLVNSGTRWYDEESGITVARFLIDNIEDVIEEFDAKLYQKIATLARDRMVATGSPPEFGWYSNHPDVEVKKFAQDTSMSAYHFSPGWEKRYDVVLRQPMPEENFQLDSDSSLLHFRLRKINRKCRRNVEKIREFAAAGDDEKVMLYLNLQTRLQQVRTELAAELGVVVIDGS